MEKIQANTNTPTPTTSVLHQHIIAAETLSQTDKLTYIHMATMFNQDLANNIILTSIDLANKYPQAYHNPATGTPTIINSDKWLEWTNYPPIKKYIQDYLDNTIQKQADQLLTTGQSDPIKVKQLLQKQNQQDNFQFIITRLPDKQKREDQKEHNQKGDDNDL